MPLLHVHSNVGFVSVLKFPAIEKQGWVSGKVEADRSPGGNTHPLIQKSSGASAADA